MYRGELSLRALWVRVMALPPDSPLMLQLEQDRAETEARAEYDSIDETLAMLKRG